MPLVNPKVNLKDSFQYTNLDLEDSGPISTPTFTPQWTPNTEYINSTKGQAQDGVLQYEGFNGPKGLDLENNGPRNASKYNHQQNWTPSSKFTQNPQGQKQGGKLNPQAFKGPENLDIETNPKSSFPKSPSGKQKFGFIQQWGPNANEYQGADLGDSGVGLYNEDNSLKGNLDVENNPPIPASTGKNGGTFIQRYSPNSQFINSPEGDLSSDKLENKLNQPRAVDSLNNTLGQSNLPSNKEMGFVQRYSSANEYTNTPQGQLRSNNSPAEQNNFRTSALDLESTSAGVKQGGSGGPINVSYTSKVGSETMSKTTTQPYTPQQTYRDFWQSKGGIDLNNLTDSYK